MVCDEGEPPSIEVLMELFHSEYEGQGLFFELSVILFGWGESARSE